MYISTYSLCRQYMVGSGQPRATESAFCRLRLKCDGTRAETRFRLSSKRTSPLKSAGASVQSTTGSRVVRISGSNAGCTMFRGSVKSTGYPLHSPVSPSLALPCVTVCHHISTGLYPLNMGLGTLQSQSMYFGESRRHVCLSGIELDSSAFSPYPSSYTDLAIPAFR
jgi:hypothetical protein